MLKVLERKVNEPAHSDIRSVGGLSWGPSAKNGSCMIGWTRIRRGTPIVVHYDPGNHEKALTIRDFRFPDALPRFQFTTNFSYGLVAEAAAGFSADVGLAVGVVLADFNGCAWS
jgi:hypothetical protein